MPKRLKMAELRVDSKPDGHDLNADLNKGLIKGMKG